MGEAGKTSRVGVVGAMNIYRGIKLNRVLCLFLSLIFFSSFTGNAESRGDRGCQLEDSVLTIGSGIKKIEAFGYRDREDISEVRFAAGSGIISIGDYAFLGCVNLKRIILPSSLVSLGEGCFRECESLEEITLPRNMKKLPKYLFYFCDRLRKVTLPARLEVIERNCFAYCRSLEDISFPNSLRNIGMNAFTRCESLKEVVVPKSVSYLESYAFSDCKGMKVITFPANGCELGELILSGCDGLERVIEPSTVVPKFECNSFPFEPDEYSKYDNIELCVPSGMEKAYREAGGWKLFKNIEVCAE
ncbi:MAG: leucine-rich repeat domain-containing protein [Muribaculaceae bacterium]|nr:leucine-rich repeat domain-containing protein [Muribaculaceae bacterium]